MDKTSPILRTAAETSLLEEKSNTSMKVISSRLFHLILHNDSYFRRCLSQVEEGKKELQKILSDARLIISKDEDLINLLYKVKEDAISETELIFIKYDASIMDEANIDFERAGFLAGIYDEIERYLKLMVSIEPLDKNKAHYSILDGLEKIDEEFLKLDNIPGYYATQKDKRILKHPFDLESLDDYWSNYLSLKDKFEVGEGFGDIKHLMNQYHSEFCWEMTKIRPRQDLKSFLNYHLNKFSGEQLDFINHIEFRILPKVYAFAGNDYPIYQSIIREWLKELKTALTRSEELYLLESITSVSATFIDNVFEYRKAEDENKYNTIICSLLNQRFSSRSWSVKDQSLGGSSNSTSKAKRAGLSFRDIIISNERNRHLSAIECFRLEYVPTKSEKDSEIQKHLTKIFKNEPIGLSPLFIIIYCETKSFSKTWEKYVNYIGNIIFPQYELIDLVKEVHIKPEAANLKVSKAIHKRESNEIEIYHIFINLFP